MLSPSPKNPAHYCAGYALLVGVVALFAYLVCQPARAQEAAAGAPPAAQAPQPAAPAPATKAPASEAKAAAPDKAPAPRLDRNYSGLTIPADEQKYISDYSEIRKILRAGTIPPGKEDFFTDYYRNYGLARWTFTDRLNEVAKFRAELKRDLLMSYKPNRSNPAHSQLTTLALNFLSICTDPKTLSNPKYNFSPVTRFNAIMMIGDLNQAEAATGGKEPVPLPAALPILVDRATNSEQIDAVRLGALLGIRRHCRLMPENAQVPGDITKLLVDLVRAKESERVRSPEGHAWLRLVAIQTFGDLKGRPNTPAVARELLKVIAETDSPDFLRYAAASALGELNYQNAAGLDMNVLLQALGLLSIEVCDQERQRMRDQMESEKKPTPSGAYGPYAGSGAMESDTSSYGDMQSEYGGYGPGGMTSKKTTKDDRQIERVRRRLKDGMTAALIGMGKKSKTLRRGEKPGGISALAGTDPTRNENIAAFSDAIHDFFKVIDTKDDDKQIEAKPLDEAVAEVRGKLGEALAQIGGQAPEAPEFEPLPEPKPAGALGSGYEEMYGGGPPR